MARESIQQTEAWDLRSGPARLETEQDFRDEEQVCFGDIDFDLYSDSETDFSGPSGHSPYGLEHSRLLTPEGETLLFRRLSFLSVRTEAVRCALKSVKSARAGRKRRLELDELESQLNSTRNEIAQANLRLVASVARRLSNSPDDFEEMFSEGNTILLYAINKFDYTRGYRFSTYLTHAVQRHLFRFLKRRSTRQFREIQGEQDRMSELAGAADEFSELTPDQELAIAQKIIEAIDVALDERERLIVKGRLGLDKTRRGQTFQTLGEQLGLSKERTRQLFQRAIQKLEEVAAPYAKLFE